MAASLASVPLCEPTPSVLCSVSVCGHERVMCSAVWIQTSPMESAPCA